MVHLREELQGALGDLRREISDVKTVLRRPQGAQQSPGTRLAMHSALRQDPGRFAREYTDAKQAWDSVRQLGVGGAVLLPTTRIPLVVPSEQLPSSAAHREFDGLDTNQDGVIDRNEFVAGASEPSSALRRQLAAAQDEIAQLKLKLQIAPNEEHPSGVVSTAPAAVNLSKLLSSRLSTETLESIKFALEAAQDRCETPPKKSHSRRPREPSGSAAQRWLNEQERRYCSKEDEDETTNLRSESGGAHVDAAKESLQAALDSGEAALAHAHEALNPPKGNQMKPEAAGQATSGALAEPTACGKPPLDPAHLSTGLGASGQQHLPNTAAQHVQQWLNEVLKSGDPGAVSEAQQALTMAEAKQQAADTEAARTREAESTVESAKRRLIDALAGGDRVAVERAQQALKRSEDKLQALNSETANQRRAAQAVDSARKAVAEATALEDAAAMVRAHQRLDEAELVQQRLLNEAAVQREAEAFVSAAKQALIAALASGNPAAVAAAQEALAAAESSQQALSNAAAAGAQEPSAKGGADVARVLAIADRVEMDSNNDGVVDEQELVAAGGTKQEFNRYDVNGDGMLGDGEMAARAADALQQQQPGSSAGSAGAVGAAESALERAIASGDPSAVAKSQQVLAIAEAKQQAMEAELARLTRAEAAVSSANQALQEALAGGDPFTVAKMQQALSNSDSKFKALAKQANKGRAAWEALQRARQQAQTDVSDAEAHQAVKAAESQLKLLETEMIRQNQAESTVEAARQALINALASGDSAVMAKAQQTLAKAELKQQALVGQLLRLSEAELALDSVKNRIQTAVASGDPAAVAKAHQGLAEAEADLLAVKCQMLKQLETECAVEQAREALITALSSGDQAAATQAQQTLTDAGLAREALLSQAMKLHEGALAVSAAKQALIAVITTGDPAAIAAAQEVLAAAESSQQALSNAAAAGAQEPSAKGGADVARVLAIADRVEMDSNNDGVVDEQELVAAGGTKQEFNRYDVNGDGMLDDGEMAARAADALQQPGSNQGANGLVLTPAEIEWMGYMEGYHRPLTTNIQAAAQSSIEQKPREEQLQAAVDAAQELLRRALESGDPLAVAKASQALAVLQQAIPSGSSVHSLKPESLLEVVGLTDQQAPSTKAIEAMGVASYVRFALWQVAGLPVGIGRLFRQLEFVTGDNYGATKQPNHLQSAMHEALVQLVTNQAPGRNLEKFYNRLQRRRNSHDLARERTRQNEVAAAAKAEAAPEALAAPIEAEVTPASAADTTVVKTGISDSTAKPRFQWSKEARNAAQRARQMVLNLK